MAIAEWYRRSVEEFADRVRAVGDDQWNRPTPCSDWDVRELVNHVVGEQRWAVPLMEGATIAEVGSRLDGDLLGAEPVKASDEAAGEAIDAMAAPDALTRTVHVSFGDIPAEEYAWQLFADHVVHGWDLSKATAADTRLDPELVEALTGWFAAQEDMYRAGGAVGPRVPVPDGADAQTRLLAAFGRSADWTP